MAIDGLKVRGSWREVADAARTTIGRGPGKKEPSSRWKKNMLLAEHSPIRQLMVKWKWSIKSWISVHFVRHKIGIEHYVSTQRDDRRAKPKASSLSDETNGRQVSGADVSTTDKVVERDGSAQGTRVNHECIGNAQAIINISRKRLCTQAHKETRAAWREFLLELKPHEPELVSVCVPECVYRGFCPEMKGCGFNETIGFPQILDDYRRK